MTHSYIFHNRNNNTAYISCISYDKASNTLGEITTFEIPAHGRCYYTFPHPCLFAVPIEAYKYEFLTNSFNLIEITTRETCEWIVDARIISRTLDVTEYVRFHPEIGPATLVTDRNDDVIQIEKFLLGELERRYYLEDCKEPDV